MTAPAVEHVADIESCKTELAVSWGLPITYMLTNHASCLRLLSAATAMDSFACKCLRMEPLVRAVAGVPRHGTDTAGLCWACVVEP